MLTIGRRLKNLCLVVFILLFSLLLQTGFAQYTYELDKTTRFDHMSATEGLSTSLTYCIYQDSYGFIWIGNGGGLDLYDGYEVKIFGADPKNPEASLRGGVTNIFEESNGTLWFCTGKGISKYNRANQTFRNYMPDTVNINNRINVARRIVQQDSNYLWVDANYDLFLFKKETGEFQSFAKDTLDPSKGMYGIWSIYVFIDKEGTFWHVSGGPDTSYALSKFNKESQTFTHFVIYPDDPESFANFDVKSMIEDRDGTLWIATRGGGLLEVLDKEKGKFRHYIHSTSDTNSIISNLLSTVFEDSKGKIWVGGNGGFALMNKETGGFTNFKIPNRTDFPDKANRINDIQEDTHGNLYLAAVNLFIFHPEIGSLYHYVEDYNNPNSLSDDYIRQMLIDHSGMLWIVTWNHGISRMNPYANTFKHIPKIPYLQNSLSSNDITSVMVDSRDYLWVGCWDGTLDRIKFTKGRLIGDFDHFAHDKNNPKSISGRSVFEMYEDKKNQLWFGSYYGLNRYDYNNHDFTSFLHNPTDSTSISSNEVENIYQDRKGTFWVGTRNGLNIMDENTGKFIRYLPNEKAINGIVNSSIRASLEDSDGDIWFVGKCLERVKREDTTFIQYSFDFNNYTVEVSTTDDMETFIIFDIKEDDSSNLWLATVEKGLICINRKTMTFKALTTEQGLASKHIVGLEVDNNSDMWAKTNKGLSRIRFNTHEIKNFNIADGLIDNDMTIKSRFKDKNGWLFFGTNNGLVYFHPDSLQENTHIPPVHITDLKIGDDQQYFDQPLFEMNKVEFNYNENDISFDFVALDYINPQKNQYAFMLEGYDEDWKYVGNRRTAYYTNLNPGKYTFKVKGSNNDGYWNEEGASLSLIIQPPFWATWWAYGIYAFLFLGGIWLIRRNELNKIKLRQALELEQVHAESLSNLDKEKNKFFSNISHEFRTPLTLILGPLDSLIAGSNKEKEKEKLNLVQRNARRLQTLINQLLSLSKLESGNLKLKARPENIVALTRLLLESFHSLAEDRGIHIDFESDAEQYTVYIDKLKFEKIVNNLLSNAFKFTERGGKILVSLQSTAGSMQSDKIKEPTADCIQIQFSDTGIGIREERLKHVFDRFYQVDEQQKKSDLGTGIGLALTKELVELHQGEINVESKFGMGTTFTVFLPLGKDHLAEDEVFDSPGTEDDLDDEMLQEGQVFVPDAVTKTVIGKTPIPEENGQPLLLIVEDNADMRSYIKSYLVEDYQVMEASNGKEGAEMAIQHIPDLIVSDLMMPLVDGHEMTTQLKQDERTSHIPIILLTAKAGTESKIEGLETGADDFLTKPFDAKELLVRIKNLIVQRQRLRELLSDHVGDVEQTRLIKQSVGPAMNKLDEQFLGKAKTVVVENLSDSEFTVEQFAIEMAMSRVQLHRKLKGLADHSPTDFIRDIRLTKAAELLRAGELNVTQISYEIGISSLSYFSRAFKDKFGVSPSDYL